MKIPNSIKKFDELTPFLKEADHIDVKIIEGDVSLRQFIAQSMGYMPGWVRFLYRVRWLFVRMLGMTQDGVPSSSPEIDPARVSFRPGDKQAFFTVKAGEEDRYLVTGATEPHLTAHLAVVTEPINAKRNRFYAVTIVHYHKWTGPVYFNVIRPFHHIVVGQMVKAGVA